MKPKKKTNSGEGSFHDPLQRKWLRLGEVINLARGATDDLKRDWPPPEPWLGHFKDLKAAVEYSELQVARPPILADKRTPVSLENLSAFAVRQDALWGWLRDFCQRWRAARGNVLEETEKPRGHTSTRNPWTQPRTDYWKNRKTEILRDPTHTPARLRRTATLFARSATIHPAIPIFRR